MANRIRELRKQKGITMKQLGAVVGLAESTISQYENGKREPDNETLLRFGEYFGVTVGYLLGVEDAQPEIIPYSPTHRIPILGRISAGLPLYAEEHIEGYTYTELNGGAEYFALQVSGDSMNAARIQEGDTLIVRRQDVVENGEIAVVIVGDDEATVKRFYKSGSIVTLMPQSTNPSHQPQIYDTKQTSIRIVGLVVKNEISF